MLDIYEHFCYTNTINKTKERQQWIIRYSDMQE